MLRKTFRTEWASALAASNAMVSSRCSRMSMFLETSTFFASSPYNLANRSCVLRIMVKYFALSNGCSSDLTQSGAGFRIRQRYGSGRSKNKVDEPEVAALDARLKPYLIILKAIMLIRA